MRIMRIDLSNINFVRFFGWTIGNKPWCKETERDERESQFQAIEKRRWHMCKLIEPYTIEYLTKTACIDKVRTTCRDSNLQDHSDVHVEGERYAN